MNYPVIAFILFLVANIADAITTIAAIKRGAVESNPIYGKHPSASRVWLTKLVAAIAAVVFLRYFPQGAIGLVALAVLFGYVAWRNSRVD